MSTRSVLLGVVFSLGLALALSAERVWVSNAGGGTLVFFEPGSNVLLGTVTVGSGPVDMAADRAVDPQRLFVADSVSNTVSVAGLNPVGNVATIAGDSLFGTFEAPSGVARTAAGQILVVDRKTTSGPGGTGRSTIRVIDPATLQTVGGFRDASPTARYSDVVTTADGRIWIADAGDQGVAVVFPPAGPAPWDYPQTLIYQGGGDFADFVEDESDEAAVPTAKTFLIQPRRLATDGTSRVVVADGGSDVVTILDANYVAEAVAVLRNVDLGLAAGQTVSDVAVANGFAYAVSSAVSTLFRIDLSTFVVDTLALGGLLPGGLGVTSDGETLYAGAATGGDIQEVDLDPSGVAAPSLGALVAGVASDAPFAFFAEVSGSSGAAGDTPLPWISSSTGSSSESGDCGLLGVELLVLLAALGRRRRP